MQRGLFLAAGLVATLLVAACDNKQPQMTAAALEGQSIYDNNCAECHEQSHPDLLKQPPNLHGLFLRKSLPSGAPATNAQVRTTILDGKGIMPSFDQRLRDEDINHLLDYLHWLR
jgi:mono/diheme cytochrome c family protein